MRIVVIVLSEPQHLQRPITRRDSQVSYLRTPLASSTAGPPYQRELAVIAEHASLESDVLALDPAQVAEILAGLACCVPAASGVASSAAVPAMNARRLKSFIDPIRPQGAGPCCVRIVIEERATHQR